MRTIEERLDILEQKIQSEDFRKNTGLGNEVGYYVFDYDPSQELTVRTRVKKLQETNTEKKFGYELIVYDLYELMLKLIQEDDEYDDLKEMEEEEEAMPAERGGGVALVRGRQARPQAVAGGFGRLWHLRTA